MTMQELNRYPLVLYLVNEARRREIRAAALARQVPARPRNSLRRSVGHSIVRLGERLAGEPSFELARSR
jgi:hypothetical protein